MPTPLVVAYFGDRDSPSQLARLVSSSRVPIVAVVLDLGDGPPLDELRASALAAGASRCHALDVRDDFVRAVILPAARYDTDRERSEALHAFAAAFASRIVRSVADIEQGEVLDVARTDGWARAARRQSTERATLALRFVDGEPVALNDVAMLPGELAESLETIAGIPALAVLHVAIRQLAGARDGLVILRTEGGVCTPASAETVPA